MTKQYQATNLKHKNASKYVSRGGDKLASVAGYLELDFKNKLVLDAGSSTGGFTDFALQSGVAKVVAVELGSRQMHTSLRTNPQVELHEQTDIRYFVPAQAPDIIVIDLSFVSLRAILPSIAKLAGAKTQIVALLKPQFEADAGQKNKGIVKNETIRRQILKDFETWASRLFIIKAKADSKVTGAKGNHERFYVLKKL